MGYAVFLQLYQIVLVILNSFAKMFINILFSFVYSVIQGKRITILFGSRQLEYVIIIRFVRILLLLSAYKCRSDGTGDFTASLYFYLSFLMKRIKEIKKLPVISLFILTQAISFLTLAQKNLSLLVLYLHSQR